MTAAQQFDGRCLHSFKPHPDPGWGDACAEPGDGGEFCGWRRTDHVPSLAGSTHAVAHRCMLEANLGLSREEAQARTDAYLHNLDRISDDQERLRQARAAHYTDDEPPF